MASERLKELLNQAIARELQVSIQYMWQHVLGKGLCSPAVRDIFKKIAITEMKHAEEIAERLDYLGGKPTTQPAPITVGETLEEMIRIDIKAEEEAIALYKQIIEQATSEGDHVTEDLFRSILADEEEHHSEFLALLGQ
ncbi:MAG: ferritin-like domain-containing protein [Armatimonadetes bacterium]|nr:ferritin-like domain-containing protein [Armatimonadota bacterium]MCX7967844.1 ferritin-like domain-containing protein [Armatimonadota bacterium]MDW8143702.1 ferritin-like domain-containing protein [Armatimonadota bacterium]